MKKIDLGAMARSMGVPFETLKDELDSMLKEGEVKGIYLNHERFLSYSEEQINRISENISVAPVNFSAASLECDLSHSEIRTFYEHIIKIKGIGGIFSTDLNVFYSWKALEKELERLLVP